MANTFTTTHTRFLELRDNYIASKYPYKNRINLKSSTNLYTFTTRALQRLDLPLALFGDDLKKKEIQEALLNVYIAFGRLSTNVMVKGAFAHTLVSNNEFWSEISLDFSSSDVTFDSFVNFYADMLIRMSLGWGQAKVITMVGKLSNKLSNPQISEIQTRLLRRLKDDLYDTLTEAATDGSADFSSSISQPITSSVIGDDRVDNQYQTNWEKAIAQYLTVHNIGFSDDDLQKLQITFFKPNNDPLNPYSTINAEDVFVFVEEHTRNIVTTNEEGEEVVYSVSYLGKVKQVNLQTGAIESATVPYQKDVGWFLEWAPSQPLGIVKIPIEEAYPEKLPIENVFSIKDITATENLDVYMSAIHYMPLSAERQAMFNQVSHSRNVITSTQITFGAKYIQAVTENFPQFSARISVVRFSGVLQRVLNFLDALVTFSSNPRKYPGSIYLYSVFEPSMPSMQPTLYRKKAYKKYEILITNYYQEANSNTNTIINVTFSGVILGGYGDD